MPMREVIMFGTRRVAFCDGLCSKAWGINNRPRRQLSEHEDDYVFLGDDELGEAPSDPGTYEGGDAKPTPPVERLNKWCVRECERSSVEDYRDMKHPRPNMRKRDPLPGRGDGA